LRFQQRRFLQQREQVSRFDRKHALDDVHFIGGEPEPAQRPREIHQQARIRAVARDRAFQQLTRRDSVTTAQLVQGGLIENRRMLGIDGFDAQEQRIGARAVAACECAFSLRDQRADLAGCLRNAQSNLLLSTCRQSSKRVPHDRQCNRAHCPFVRRRSCMQS
jgi:hypothetical protein